MSDIPDGADAVVARMAIAWEITKKIAARSLASSSDSDDERKKSWVALYNEIYEELKGKAAKAGAR